MGKILKFFMLAFVMTVISAMPVLAEGNPVKVYVSGKLLTNTDMKDSSPEEWTSIFENNRTLTPINLLSSQLGLDVEYLEDGKISKIRKDERVIELQIASKDARVNGKQVGLDAEPIMKNNTLFVPLRFISEVLGKKVLWDPRGKIALVGEFTGENITKDTFVYRNKENSYTLNFPNSWKEEAIIKTKDGNLYVYDKKSAERFIEDGYENFGPVFEIRSSDYPVTASFPYEGDYVLHYKDGKYIEVLFGRDFQFYPETLDSYKKIAGEAEKILGSFRIIEDTEIDKFWDDLVSIPDNPPGPDIYWRYIDDDIRVKADGLIEEYGPEVLFQGLESNNIYSQYYCINRLVEYYNQDDIRIRAIEEISPFLGSSNNSLRQGAEFALSVLNKKFDNPYIIRGKNNTQIFALFNNYSDYGSYQELWIIKNDKLSRLHSFTDTGIGSQLYIDANEPMKLSLSQNKLAVKISTRRSNSLYIFDLYSEELIPSIMTLLIDKVAKDNKDYKNTYPEGQYSFYENLKWLDDDTVEFEADLAYNYMEIIERVRVKYNTSNGSLEYIKR